MALLLGAAYGDDQSVNKISALGCFAFIDQILNGQMLICFKLDPRAASDTPGALIEETM